MIKRNNIKIIYLFHVTAIILLISCKAIGGVKIINQTGIELEAVGTFSSHATEKCTAHTELIKFRAKKDGGTVYFDWGRKRNDPHCVPSYYFQLRNIALYKDDTGQSPILSVSTCSQHFMLTIVGKLFPKGSRSPEVNINREKIKLMMNSNCFGKKRQKECKLIIKKHNAE